MNTQEREQLTRFLQELKAASAGTKDGDAEQLIREACSHQPDASYLLVQRCLLLDQAVSTVQTENARLQREVETLRGGSSGNFLNATAWGNSGARDATPQPGVRSAPSALPMSAGPAAPLASPAPVSNPSAWGSNILGSVATTAVGVVAGSFLFQGIGHLLGQHGSGSGSGFLGNQSSPQRAEAPVEQALSDQWTTPGEAERDLDSLVPSDADFDVI